MTGSGLTATVPPKTSTYTVEAFESVIKGVTEIIKGDAGNGGTCDGHDGHDSHDT